MLAMLRDWQQMLSWKLGRGHGKANRPFRCPWWADDVVYVLAYMQGKGVDIPKFEDAFP
jgi:hypothetical protein